jgi:hypothetical protein
MDLPKFIGLAFKGQSSKELKERAAKFRKKRLAISSSAPKKAKKARITCPPEMTKETDSTASLATVDAVMIATPRLASPPSPKKKKASVPS